MFPTRSPHRRYCSELCARAAEQRARVAREHRSPRPCEQCGTVFSPKPTTFSGRYCSQHCSALAHKERVAPDLVKCLYCSAVFHPTVRVGSNFCSTPCRRAYIREIQLLEDAGRINEW